MIMIFRKGTGMHKFKSLIRLFTVAVFMIISSSQLFAWGGRLHMKMVSDAFHIMPKAFRTYLTGPNATKAKTKAIVKELMNASVEPDRVLKDFTNHVFHVQGYNLGKGPFRIQELVDEVAKDIREKKSKKVIIQKLGWISHYTCDLVQPLHTGTCPEERSYHSAFEKAVDEHAYYYGVKFDGCQSLKRISTKIIYDALWANQYYDAIEYAYTKGKRYETTRQIAAKCYSRGVNNVVDLWYTIWTKAGGKTSKNDQKGRYFPPIKKETKASIAELEKKNEAHRKRMAAKKAKEKELERVEEMR